MIGDFSWLFIAHIHRHYYIEIAVVFFYSEWFITSHVLYLNFLVFMMIPSRLFEFDAFVVGRFVRSIFTN